MRIAARIWLFDQHNVHNIRKYKLLDQPLLSKPSFGSQFQCNANVSRFPLHQVSCEHLKMTSYVSFIIMRAFLLSTAPSHIYSSGTNDRENPSQFVVSLVFTSTSIKLCKSVRYYTISNSVNLLYVSFTSTYFHKLSTN